MTVTDPGDCEAACCWFDQSGRLATYSFPVSVLRSGAGRNAIAPQSVEGLMRRNSDQLGVTRAEPIEVIHRTAEAVAS